MQGWDESTESKYLVGKTMPAAGISCTLIKIRRELMQALDQPEGVMETKFIASFAEPDVKEWIMNKTGREFLKNSCGINDANVASFAPIPLLLMQTPARGSFNPGIGVMTRNISSDEARENAADAQPVGVPAQLAPPDDSDVPF